MHLTLDRPIGGIFSEEWIPREAFFRQPSCLAIKLSPDGKRLAYVGGDLEGTMNLFITQEISLEHATQVTFFKEPEIREFHWAPDGGKIYFLKDTDGTKQFHLLSVDVNSLKVQDYTPFEGAQAKIFYLCKTTSQAIVGLNVRNPQFHDLYRLDLTSGTVSFFYENTRFIRFLFNKHLEVAIKVSMNEDSSLSLWDQNESLLFHISSEDAFHTECLHVNEEENVLYLIDNRRSDTTRLKKVNLGDPTKETLLGYDEKSDITSVLFEEGQPVAYSTTLFYQKWHPLQERVKCDLEALEANLGPHFSITHQSDDNQMWILKNTTPRKGIEFWSYSRASQSLLLLYRFPEIASLVEMHPILIPTRDELELVSYLTLPQESEEKPGQPFPLVVIPHGGPFKIRDFYTFSPFHQWLANRGYAVLSVNFRLSSGFGKAFVNAGNGQWGKKAHQDILDAVEWCIDAKITEKGKIAIFGISYGGYEALASLAFTPEVFACGIAICGPSNLKTVLDKVPFYWEVPSSPLSEKTVLFTKNAFIKSMGGDPNEQSGNAYLQSCSPLNYVESIQKPLLLVHGANDPIVAASESDQIFEKMKQKKCPAIYLSFPDEGHGIVKFKNAMCYLAHSEWLLAKVLGGGYEPISQEQVGASSAHIQTSKFSPQ